MAKRRGFFRRLLDVFRRPQPKPQPRPEPERVAPRVPTPERNRQRRAIERMANLSGFANRNRITRNVGQMTPEEIDFVLTATDDELKSAARRDADRVISKDGGLIPLNPFWYR